MSQLNSANFAAISIRCMRTTLDIDDDVLAAAKELAAARSTTTGQVISELARQTLTRPRTGDAPPMRNGVTQLPHRDAAVTPEFVGKLLNDDI
jgi:hypothetical protein